MVSFKKNNNKKGKIEQPLKDVVAQPTSKSTEVREAVKDTKKKKEAKKAEKNILKDGYPIAASFTNNVGNLIKILFAITLCFLMSLIGLYWSMSNKIDKIESKVFVVKEGKAYLALETGNSDNGNLVDKAEVLNHIKTFLLNMFSYNKVNFEDRVSTAMELVSPVDGKILFDALNNARTKEMLITTGQSTEVRIDSIRADLLPGTDNNFKVNAYYFVDTYYQNQKATDGHKISCFVERTSRSIENPHGLLIKNINYFPYSPDK